MDIAHPLRSVIPSLDSAVFEVLASTTQPLSGLQVAKLARTGSISGVRLVLGRLVEHGLVSREDRGRSSYFTANRAHLAWPAIDDLLHLRATLEEHIIALVGDWGLPPVNLSVYGSVARQEAGPESDVDLLIIEPGAATDTSDWEAQLAEFATAVENWSGNRAQLVTLSVDGLAEHVASKEPIVEAWLSDARTLVGRNIQELIAEVAHVAKSGRKVH
jgi:predicted nucleotidyltransferase